DERLGALVVLVDVFVEGTDQFQHAAENATPQAVLSEITKESLHHVQPGGTGGRELDVKPGMLLQPALYAGVFVSAVIVGNQIQVFSRGRRLVEQSEELQPLLVPMTLLTKTNHLAAGHIQCRE